MKQTHFQTLFFQFLRQSPGSDRLTGLISGRSYENRMHGRPPKRTALFQPLNIDDLVKSHRNDGFVGSSHMQGAQIRGGRGSSRVRCNGAVEAQRRRWTFYETINIRLPSEEMETGTRPFLAESRRIIAKGGRSVNQADPPEVWKEGIMFKSAEPPPPELF